MPDRSEFTPAGPVRFRFGGGHRQRRLRENPGQRAGIRLVLSRWISQRGVRSPRSYLLDPQRRTVRSTQPVSSSLWDPGPSDLSQGSIHHPPDSCLFECLKQTSQSAIQRVSVSMLDPSCALDWHLKQKAQIQAPNYPQLPVDQIRVSGN